VVVLVDAHYARFEDGMLYFNRFRVTSTPSRRG